MTPGDSRTPHSAGSFAVESLGVDNGLDAVQEEKVPALRSVSSSSSEAGARAMSEVGTST